MLKTTLKCILYFALIFSLLIPVLSLTSCDRKYDEEEVRTEAERLLKESELLNLVLFGKGIEINRHGNQSGAYYEANFLHLNQLGFTTVAQLKDMVRATFTAEYSNLVFSTVFSSVNVDGFAVSNARYYQLYGDQMAQSDPICIMVHSEYVYHFVDSVEYDYSSIRVKDVKKNTLYVSVNATVTSLDGRTQSREIVFELIEESEGWRINSHTYVNYNAYSDKYDDLAGDKL